jgi:hypothetical protein
MSDSVRFEFSCAMVATATSAGADRKLPGNRTLSPFTRPLNCPPSSVSHPEIIKCINGGNECDLSHSLTALITDHYVDLMHIVTHRLTSIATFVFRQRITDRHKKISWKYLSPGNEAVQPGHRKIYPEEFTSKLFSTTSNTLTLVLIVFSFSKKKAIRNSNNNNN